MMPSVIFIIVIVIAPVVFDQGALCQLTPIGQQHIEAVAHTPVMIGCRNHNSSQPIRWQYVIPGKNRPLMIFDGSVIHKKSRGRIDVKFNNETGQSNLTIKSVQLNDTGQYQCLEMNITYKISFNISVVEQKEDGVGSTPAVRPGASKPQANTKDANSQWMPFAVAGACFVATVAISLSTIYYIRKKASDNIPSVATDVVNERSTSRLAINADIADQFAVLYDDAASVMNSHTQPQQRHQQQQLDVPNELNVYAEVNRGELASGAAGFGSSSAVEVAPAASHSGQQDNINYYQASPLYAEATNSHPAANSINTSNTLGSNGSASASLSKFC